MTLKEEICRLLYSINFQTGDSMARDFRIDVSDCGDDDEEISKICEEVPFEDVASYLEETIDILETDNPRLYYEYEKEINNIYKKM